MPIRLVRLGLRVAAIALALVAAFALYVAGAFSSDVRVFHCATGAALGAFVTPKDLA